MNGLIERLFGADADIFRASCWPNLQRHLYVNGLDLAHRVPELFEGPLTGTLDALLAAHRGPVTAQGADAAGRSHVMFDVDRAEVGVLLAHGVCVQLLDAHRSFPAVDALMHELHAALGLPKVESAPTIFVTPPGARLGKHFDDKDVWVFGLTGTKHFWVAPNTEHTFPNRIVSADVPGARVTLDEASHMPAGATRCRVERGDCLFMPRGYWHDTVAADSLCWSLSLGIKRPTLAELCLSTLRARLAEHPHVAEGFVSTSEGSSADVEQAISAALALVRDLLDATTPEDVLARYRGAGAAGGSVTS